jgi:hypothetical protein
MTLYIGPWVLRDDLFGWTGGAGSLPDDAGLCLQ